MKRKLVFFLIMLSLTLTACGGAQTSASMSNVVDHTVSTTDTEADICGVHVTIQTKYEFGQTTLNISYGSETVNMDQNKNGSRTLGGKTMIIAYFHTEGLIRVWCPK